MGEDGELGGGAGPTLGVGCKPLKLYISHIPFAKSINKSQSQRTVLMSALQKGPDGLPAQSSRASTQGQSLRLWQRLATSSGSGLRARSPAGPQSGFDRLPPSRAAPCICFIWRDPQFLQLSGHMYAPQTTPRVTTQPQGSVRYFLRPQDVHSPPAVRPPPVEMARRCV